MTENLKKKTTIAIAWSGLERFSVYIIRFVLGLVLARLLEPNDYGLIGMLTIFIAISQTIVDSGFSSALIQKQNRNEHDLSTVFYFNIAIGILLYAILFLSAPSIANFYQKPILESLTKVIGINIVISSISIIQITKLTIDIDFKTQTKINATSAIISGVIGIIMAFRGLGVWSLVIKNISSNIINAILLWSGSKWRPSKSFNKNSFFQLSSYGFRLLGAGLLNTIFDNLYLMLIGKFFSAQELGFYTRAKQFKDLPSNNFTLIIQRVTFPVLSTIQDDEKRLQMAYNKIFRLSAYIITPILVLLIIISKPLIVVILTEKWLPSAYMLQIISIAGIFLPLTIINNNIYKVIGRTDVFFRIVIVRHIITAVTLIITIQIGINAVLWGQVVSVLLNFFISSYYAGRFISYNTKSQIIDILRIFLYSIPMAISSYYLCSILKSYILSIVIIPVVALIIYTLSSMILGSKELIDLRIQFNNIIKR